MLQHLPSSPLFPYTTLFRSVSGPSSNGSGSGSTSTSGGGGTSGGSGSGSGVVSPVLGGSSGGGVGGEDRKSTRLNSSHPSISYAVFCLNKKIQIPSNEPC